MLKNVFSKIAGYTISFGIILSVFEASYAQAISLSFYQDGFPNNGFLRGEFNGEDNNNDGYITINTISTFAREEGDDSGHIVMEYLSDGLERVYVNSFFLSDHSFRYSILSNQLIGSIDQRYVGVYMYQDQRGRITTCVWAVFGQECTNSPLVVQNLSDNNNSNNSSTEVPEASLVAALATFSLAVLLKGNKKTCFK